jgi:hypothetical protein
MSNGTLFDGVGVIRTKREGGVLTPVRSAISCAPTWPRITGGQVRGGR